MPGASEAADPGEVDADRDREPPRELHGAAEPRLDGLASPMADHTRWRILLPPRWPALGLGQGIPLLARQLVG